MTTISVITTAYNSAGTISDTLGSVASQTHPNVEHIIVDGKSSDDTLKIVQRYPHVAKVVSEPDSGIYDAMNKGIKVATGDIIGILNSDDVYFDEQVLAKVDSALANADACYGDLQYVSANDLSQVVRYWKSDHFNSHSFYMGWMPPHPTFFVRKAIYRDAGLFNLCLRSAADYEFMLRVFLKHNYRIAYIPEVLVKMRVGGVSNVSLKNRLIANLEDRKAWEMNDLKPSFYTLYFKPLRKLTQFILR